MTKPDASSIRDRPIRTPADLQLMWEVLMGEGGFGRRSLWIAFLGPDDRPVPVLVPIDDMPVEPDDASIDGLRHLFADLGADGSYGSAVLLLSRPGPAAMEASDRAWARRLAALSRWPIHLATTGRVQVFAPDDLLAETARADRP